MESANIPHHLDLLQEQQQQVGYGASSNSSNQFPWSPTSSPHINNVGNRIYQNPNPNPNTELYNTRKYTGEKDENGEVQNPWSSNSARNPTEDHHQHQTLIPTHDQTCNRSKLDLFNSLLFPKFSDMICSNQSSIEDLQHLSPTGYLKNDSFQDLNLQHDTKVSPSGFFQPQFQAAQFLSNPQIYSGYERSSSSLPLIPSRGNFTQIFPSIDISSLNNTESNSASSGPFDMNLQALDLLTSARFNGHIRHDRQSHHLGLPRESPAFEHRPTTSPNKLQPSFHGGSTTEAKRPQSETKPSQSSSKKSRSDSPACPPFKVRKEKLGDRIAALQQLVAPFGKTDTASVLMEAIGYIKFLQSQVETLSVPYMKSTRTRHIKPTQMGRLAAIDGNVESRPDLRSRGLCLVPLSCMSYVTDDGARGWPSSEYHGRT